MGYLTRNCLNTPQPEHSQFHYDTLADNSEFLLQESPHKSLKISALYITFSIVLFSAMSLKRFPLFE